MENDQEYEFKAIQYLEDYRSGGELIFSDLGIDKSKLVEMYFKSRDVVRQNVDELKLSRSAESLWSTCIRVVRCSGVVGDPAKKLLINGQFSSPDAKSLYDHAVTLYVELKELQKC